MDQYLKYLLPFSAAVLFSAGLTPVIRRAAYRFGIVAEPRQERWHTQSTALLGGVAIFGAFALALGFSGLLWPKASGLTKFLPLFLCTLLVFLLGLADDIYHLSPQTKLVGQIIAAAILVFSGFKINWFVSYTMNTFVSVFWIVGITNAFNILDNMDGLAAGIGCISALFIAIIILVSLGPVNGGLMVLAALIGALGGFLLYNFYPASIFMGDCGSLIVGFLLAGMTTQQQVFRSSHFLPIIAVPVLILFIPILDTGFVSVMRTLFARSVARGGRDHSSHRLVAIGLPERTAVLTLYGFSLAGGAVALAGVLYPTSIFFTCMVVFFLVSLFFWLYLARVRVYPEKEKTLVERSRLLTTFWIDFTYKRRIFEVLLDVFLVSFGYWFSYFLRFEGKMYKSNFPFFLKSLPIVLACLMLAHFAFGVYRGVWRYTSIAEVITYVKAITVGIVMSVLANVFIYRFDGFSRTIFVIFWGISFLFLGGSRLSFRLIGELMRRNSKANGNRVLIYGAGDKGEFALREIAKNPSLALTAVGFIDDDAKKHRKKIQGVKVLGGRDKLAQFVSKHNVNEIVVASGTIRQEKLRAVCTECAQLGVTLRNLELSIKRVDKE